MKDLISIIVPAYNIENELAACLDSILAQTHREIEIVVVNDGSSDKTGEIADMYAKKDSRVKAIHKENGGVTSARLRGVAEASGDWIGFVDGDDMIDPDMYDRLLENAKKYDADISHCGYRMCFPNGRADYYYNTGCLEKQNRTAALRELISGVRIEPGLVNKLFHKSLLDHLLRDAIMPTDIKINEDLLMNYYLFKSAQATVYEDFCPYQYILRKGSAATASVNPHKLGDPIKVMRIILADVDKAVYPTALSRYLRAQISLATMSLSPYKNDKLKKEMVRPYRKEARRELRRHMGKALSVPIGAKMKIITLWCALLPSMYALVHNTYSKIVGNDKKYDF